MGGAWFKGDVEGGAGAGGGATGGGDGFALGMRLPGPVVPAFSENGAGGRNDNGAHGRVGAGQAYAFFCLAQGDGHEGVIDFHWGQRFSR